MFCLVQGEGAEGSKLGHLVRLQCLLWQRTSIDNCRRPNTVLSARIVMIVGVTPNYIYDGRLDVKWPVLAQNRPKPSQTGT